MFIAYQAKPTQHAQYYESFTQNFTISRTMWSIIILCELWVICFWKEELEYTSPYTNPSTSPSEKYLLRRKRDWTLTVWILRLNPQVERFLFSTYHLWVSRIFTRDWCAKAALRSTNAKWNNRTGNSIQEEMCGHPAPGREIKDNCWCWV